MATTRLRQLDDRASDLVVAYYPLVQRIARRTWSRLPRGVDQDELVSAGVIGLIEAVERYDPARGIAFDLYAKHRIQGAILDALRATDWVPRAVRIRASGLENARKSLTSELGRAPNVAELADKLETPVEAVHALLVDADAQQPVSLDAPSEPDGPAPVDRLANGDDPEREYVAAEQRRSTAVATSQLPERERIAIERFYFQERSLKEIGAELGVSESRVSQLCSQAIKRLRSMLDTPSS
jgi:RNA polymerase sigma factor for flagellar operon FliA